MRERVKIVDEQVLAKNWGELKKVTFDFRRSDGKWQRQVRETYSRGNAAAVIPYCVETGTILLIRQFRFPVYAEGREGWLVEACAGLLDHDSPEQCARREAEEEAGVRLGELQHAFDADMSPGSVIETISCFVGSYLAKDRVSKGGGLADEGEDIEVLEIPLTEALSMMNSGKITDAKTILLLQYLALNPALFSA